MKKTRQERTLWRGLEPLEDRRLLSTTPFPVPLEAEEPLGSLVYDSSVAAEIAAPNEADRFTIDLDVDQTVTLVVDPDAGLQPAIELLAPNDASLGSAAADAAGHRAVLQVVPIAGADTYTLSVTGQSETTGSYSVRLVLNAAVEAEEHGGPANDDLASAEDLEPTFIALADGQAERGAVLGTMPSPTNAVVEYEDFESGQFNWQWTTYVSSPWGKVTVSGQGGTSNSRALRMEADSLHEDLNEAIWTVNLAAAARPRLHFSYAGAIRVPYPFAGDFAGHYAANGVAISDDGMNWHPIWQATDTGPPWEPIEYSIDLVQEAAAAGITLGGGLQIKFQQVDDGLQHDLPWDFAVYDDLKITTPVVPADDWYRFTLDDGQTATLALTTPGQDGVTLELYDGGQDLLATGVPAANVSRSINNFVDRTGDGGPDTYFVRVLGISHDYSLVVTRGADFDTEPNDGPAPNVQSTLAGGVVLGYAPLDSYAIDVQAGDTLLIATATPAAGPGEFVSNLDPLVTLYHPGGALVASDDNSAADGRNALLAHTATTTGTYTVRLTGAGGSQGEYVLIFRGSTGDPPPFEVSSTDPADGARLTSAPGQISVDFNDSVLLSTLAASDLTVGGVPATAATAVDDDTAVFDLPVGLSEGVNDVAIAGGAILDLQGTPVQPYGGTFIIDTTPPRVVDSSLLEGDVVTAGHLAFVARFDEGLLAANLDPADVELLGLLTGSHVPSVFDYQAGNSTLLLEFADLPEDTYTLTLFSGDWAFEDLLGYDLDGEPHPATTIPSGNGLSGGDFVVHFTTDWDLTPYPVPLEATKPPGSLIYERSVDGRVSDGDDVDRFTIDLEAGRTISVVVDPDATLQPIVGLYDPSGVAVGGSTATAAGQDAVLQVVPTIANGNYTLAIGGASQTAGRYAARVILNAAVEAEEHDGPANDGPATAEDLDASFITLGDGPPQRGAVLGTLPSRLGLTVRHEDFESGALGSQWTTFSSSAWGRVQVTDAYGAAGDSFALLMDRSAIGQNVLNEAVWTVDLSGVNAPQLHFSHAQWSDEPNVFNGDFVDHYNADGVAISDDGVNWHPVWDAPNGGIGTWEQHTIDLAAEAQAHGLMLGSSFQIKFQQVDNYPLLSDGRGYDEIVISTPARGEDDWYRFTLDDGQTASLVLAAPDSGQVTLDLYDAGQNLLAAGAAAEDVLLINGFLDDTGDETPDTYFAQVTGDFGTYYSLTVIRDADFDAEPNDDLDADGQDITRKGTAPGAIGSGVTPFGVTSDYVIHISVDGLRGDLLRDLVEAAPGLYPNFKRIQDQGAFTYNARTDYTHTLTLPNHVSMVTGRPVSRPSGQPATVAHGWISNVSPLPGVTLHNNHPDVDYVASTFDVVHDHGLSTGHFASKTKFVLFETSYDEIHGAPDANPIGGDNGRNKIDVSVIDIDSARLTETFLAEMADGPLNYSFLHFRDPDSNGHYYGWDTPRWNQTIVRMDDLIGEIFGLIDTDERFRDRTALVITSDHGGLGPSHTDPAVTEHYTIPYLVWGPGVPQGADLYAVDAVHHDPGRGRPDYNDPRQPLRNGGTGNRALELLGLPPIPGSSIHAAWPDAVDHYRVEVNAGDTLSIETFTPSNGLAAQPNELDPTIELYDPDGTLVASDDNGASDGRNALATHTAEATGTYTVRVLPAARSRGEYVLKVDGHTGELPSFVVTATDPADGARLASVPTQITVDFSDSVLITSLHASDLTVDGMAATAVSVVDGDTVTFDLPAGPANVARQVAIAGGAILDVDGTPVEPFFGTFTRDTVAPHVVESSVLEGDVLPAGSLAYTAGFDEQLDASSLDPTDVELVGRFSGFHLPSVFDYDPASTTLLLEFPDLPDDVYTLVLRSGDGHFKDAGGNDLDGDPHPLLTVPSGDGIAAGDFVVGFSLDADTLEARPFERLEPLGGLMFGSRDNVAVINVAGDHDDFVFFTEAGQTISAAAHPDDPAATLSIELVGLSGPIPAAGPGQPAILMPVAVPQEGIYAVRVRGDAPGTFRMDIGKNLAAEDFDTEDGNGLSIDGSDVLLGSDRFGAIGKSTPTLAVDGVLPDVDAYTVDLAGKAGRPIDVILAGWDGADFSAELLELIDVDGTTVLATAVPDPLGFPAANYDLAILDFALPADGVYTLRLTSAVEGEYGLVVVDGLVFDTEWNDPGIDPLRTLDQDAAALGYLDYDAWQTASAGADAYLLYLSAGQSLVLSTQTPLDHSAGSPPNELDPRLSILDPGGWLIATDSDSAPDGKNARVAFVAPQSGTYIVQVTAQSGKGEYLLRTRSAAEVIDRHVFYNNSSFDNAAVGRTDDDAVAPDKEALLPGNKASFANYTSYVRGINGIMVDVDGLPHDAVLDTEDFEFRVGNHDDPAGWPLAPPPESITVRPDAGTNGSDRITIIWSDNAIVKQWLQVTVRATAQTALAQDDVFYFGNAIGEAGNSTLNAIVNTTDEIAARNFPHGPINLATIEDPYDYDRDRLVNATDRTIARNSQTGPLTSLRLITVPPGGAAVNDAVFEEATVEESEVPASSIGGLDWLYEFEQTRTDSRQSAGGDSAEEIVDQLLAGQ